MGSVDPFSAAFDGAHRALLSYFYSSLAFRSVINLLPWPFGSLKLGGTNSPGIDLYNYFHPEYQQFRHSCGVVQKEARALIEERRTRLKDNDPDLLAIFMRALDVDGAKFSDGKLMDIVQSFVIAGRDTTACLLSWTFFILATQPEIQENLCREIDAVLGDATPTVSSLQPSSMPYLHGLVYEVCPPGMPCGSVFQALSEKKVKDWKEKRSVLYCTCNFSC